MSGPPEIALTYSSAALVALVRDFDRDANAARKLIRDILQFEPETFYSTTIEILKNGVDSPGARFLVTLLVSQNLLFRALCDPALNREQALALARRAVVIDPVVDAALARQLADATVTSPDLSGLGEASRLMDILGEVSNGPRILPSLMRMLRNSDSRVRSKAVLMIGHGNRSVKWIRSRLEETDARVRANAVEALWGMEGEEARELLDIASRDSNNRVAGNAVLGLYLMGETSALGELVKMASHTLPLFRTSAAWVMGQSGDMRFSEILGRMLADTDGLVRKTAFAAVRRIRAAVAQVSQSTQWHLAGFSSPRDPRGGQRRVQVALVTADSRETPRVLPVQFILSEDGQPVWSYRVSERAAPESMSVIFLLPRGGFHDLAPWNQGALRCLNWRRPTDLWCTVPYFSPDDIPLEIYPNLEPAVFTANAELAAAFFEQPPKWSDCSLFWGAVERSVDIGNGPVRGKRHMIVLAPVDIGKAANDTVIAAVHASRTSVQVVSTVPNPALREFCGRTGGHFLLVEDKPDAIMQQISLAYLSLLARYEIRYQSVCPDATALKLRVQTPVGWGETTVPFPSAG